MKKTTTNWLAAAEYDLATAEAMLKSHRYLYVVFMCHLAMEKTLKALYAEIRSKMPPRTHDLLHLVRDLDLTPARVHVDFIGIINNASVPTRYPEDLSRLVSQYPRRTAISYLARTKRVLKWLREHPSLAKK